MLHQKFVRMVSALPLWERDELRRFLEKGTLDESDDSRTIALLKQSCGLDPGVQGLVAMPISTNSLAALHARSDSYFLSEIRAVRDCNALPADARLPIDPGPGIQVYFGRNGSGKSSFVRLLRAAGNARVGLDVLPDVFAARASAGSAAAEFDVYVDGELRRVSWRQGADFDAELAVAVYDRDCSAVYLEGGNVAEYLPRGLDAFAALANARKRLKSAVLQEAAQLDEEIPGYSNDVEYGTRVQRVLDGLEDLDTAVQTLAVLARWIPNDAIRLKQLQDSSERVKDTRVAYAKHAERVETTRAMAKAADEAAAILAQCQRVFTKSLRDDFIALAKEIDSKRGQLEDARARAAQTHVTDSLLSGTDTSEWIALLNAAKAYSEAQAYPGKPFPVTGGECVCVLCQQSLDSTAAARLHAFAAVLERASGGGVEGDPVVIALKQDLITLEAAQNSRLRSIDDATNAAARLSKSGKFEDHVLAGNRMSDCLSMMESASAAARSSDFNSIDGNASHNLLDDAAEALRTAAVDCWSQVEDLEAKTADAPETFEEDELKELRARHWLQANVEAMQRRVAMLFKARALKGLAGELSITPITNLSKRIATELVTDQLIEALRTQLAQVGLGYIQAQVVSSGRAGVTTIRLAPPANAFKKTDMSRVLSEGEQALMGLAAFLAELQHAGHRGPIILDDPVTGLDAPNTALMADRIARLAATHQVVVMTHDDDFVADLERASSKHGSSFRRRTVSRCGSLVGVVQ